MPEHHVVLFAGAGASKAVDPASYPTTLEFFERLPESLRSHSCFTYIESFLRKDGDREVIDIEEMLWGLQTLRELFVDINKGRNLIGYSLKSARIAKLISNGWNFGQPARPGSGERPAVFLANLGPTAEYDARARWARNLFAAGGIAARCVARHSAMRKATEIVPLGLVADRAGRAAAWRARSSRRCSTRRCRTPTRR